MRYLQCNDCADTTHHSLFSVHQRGYSVYLRSRGRVGLPVGEQQQIFGNARRQQPLRAIKHHLQELKSILAALQ